MDLFIGEKIFCSRTIKFISKNDGFFFFNSTTRKNTLNYDQFEKKQDLIHMRMLQFIIPSILDLPTYSQIMIHV